MCYCPISLQYVAPTKRFRIFFNRQVFDAETLCDYISQTGNFQNPMDRSPLFESTIKRLFSSCSRALPPFDNVLRKQLFDIEERNNVIWDTALHNLDCCIKLIDAFILTPAHIQSVVHPIFLYFARSGHRMGCALVDSMKIVIQRRMEDYNVGELQLNSLISLKRIVHSCQISFADVAMPAHTITE